MKHYVNPIDGSIWAYEADGSQDDLIPIGFQRLTDEQLEVNRQAQAAALAAQVPDSVTPFQAKAALLNAGLLDAINATLSVSSPLTQLAWAEATEFKRTSPTVAALANSLGLTDAQIDDLFRAAARITA